MVILTELVLVFVNEDNMMDKSEIMELIKNLNEKVIFLRGYL